MNTPISPTSPSVTSPRLGSRTNTRMLVADYTGGLMERVALVTGGGTGIGRAVALALAGEGYAVTVCGRRMEPLQGTVVAGQARGAQMLAVQADVADPNSVTAL